MIFLLYSGLLRKSMIQSAAAVFYCGKCLLFLLCNEARLHSKLKKTDGASRPSCHAGKKPAPFCAPPFGRRLLCSLFLAVCVSAFPASRRPSEGAFCAFFSLRSLCPLFLPCAPCGRRLLYALRLCPAFSASRFLSGADFAVALI